MSRLDAIVAVSKAVLDDFKNQFGIDDRGQFHVLYNGIDLKRIDCERRDLRDELGIPKTSLVMGMIGNFINDVRDQMTVVQALPEVLSYYPAAYFIFVGAPSDVYPWCYQQCFEYCEKNGLSRRVLFLGKRHDVGNILRTLNLFVYSSNYDTFGIAVVEAMLTGVPVIVNDLPVFQEITDNGRNALIYGTKNVNDLVTKIRFAFENKTAVTEIAAKAKADARMRFSIETHINNLTKLYTSISG
jgi:glycosyltransferase involved in cell wall biosynthesis